MLRFTEPAERFYGQLIVQPEVESWRWVEWKDRLSARYRSADREFEAAQELCGLAYDGFEKFETFFEKVSDLMADVDPNMGPLKQVNSLVHTLRNLPDLQKFVITSKPTTAAELLSVARSLIRADWNHITTQQEP